MSRLAWITFAVMSVVWGGSYLLIEIAIRGGMTAPDVAWLRVCIGAALLLALSVRGGLLRSLRRHWRWLLLLAAVEICIPFPLIAAGEVHVESSLTAIIIASVPLIGAIWAWRFDPAERPDRVRGLGLAIGFVGVIALVGLDIAGSSSELLGVGAILIAAVGYSLGPVIVKHRLAALDPRAMMAGALAIATVLLAPLAAVDTPSRMPTAGAWAAVVGLGVLCTALAFVVFAILIREAGTSRATVITYVNPLVALILGVTLEGEHPGAGAVVGLLLILAGSWLSTGGKLPPAHRSAGPPRASRSASLTRT